MGEVFHKPLVLSCEPQERLELCKAGRTPPLSHKSSVSGNPFRRYDMAQICHLHPFIHCQLFTRGQVAEAAVSAGCPILPFPRLHQPALTG